MSEEKKGADKAKDGHHAPADPWFTGKKLIGIGIGLFVIGAAGSAIVSFVGSGLNTIQQHRELLVQLSLIGTAIGATMIMLGIRKENRAEELKNEQALAIAEIELKKIIAGKASA